MSAVLEEKKNMAENKNNINQVLPHEYGCEILLERTNIIQVKDPSFPTDAYLVWYVIDGEGYLDLTRGSRIRIFDMYYDKYGPGTIKKIDWGYGRVSPKLWRYKAPEKKKRK
jgi:hypothetical protein